MAVARDRAAQTPEEVRKAFLGTKERIAGIDLEPFTMGVIWLLEEIEHPTFTGTAKGNLSIRDIGRALFIYSDSAGARAALAEGIEAFDIGAHEVAKRVLPGEIAEVAAAIAKRTAEGMATVPGSGTGNPPPGA